MNENKLDLEMIDCQKLIEDFQIDHEMFVP